MAQTLIGVLLIALALLNTWATFVILRDTAYSKGQRAAQVEFVWFVPGMGAALAIYLKRKDVEPAPRGDAFGRELGDFSALDAAYGSGEPSHDSNFSDVPGGGAGEAGAN